MKSIKIFSGLTVPESQREQKLYAKLIYDGNMRTAK